MENILCFLDAPSLAAVQATEYRLRIAVAVDGCSTDTLWADRCSEDFKFNFIRSATPLISGGNLYREYLRLWLQRCEDELAHTTTPTYSRLAKGLSKYVQSQKQHGIIGAVCDICAFENRRVCRAISHKRQSSLGTVVVENSHVVLAFKKASTVRGPMTFLPLSTVNSSGLPPQSLVPPTITRTGAEEHTTIFPGFLGFASELVQLRPEHEHLRTTLLANNIFKNMQVWESEAAWATYKLYVIHKHWERRAELETQDDQGENLDIENICYVALDTYDNSTGLDDMRDDNDYDAGAANFMVFGQVAAREGHMRHRQQCHLVSHELTFEQALQKRNHARSALAFAEYGM